MRVCRLPSFEGGVCSSPTLRLNGRDICDGKGVAGGVAWIGIDDYARTADATAAGNQVQGGCEVVGFGLDGPCV